MAHYRRASTAGGRYFFTVVSYQRQAILCDDVIRAALRKAIETVRHSRPFIIDAWVLLPNHLHCIWTLPEGDSDFSTRWMMIKRLVSVNCREQYRQANLISNSKLKHRESTIWQRRFWEHQIRNDQDFNEHLDYVHFNPVKHGLVSSAAQWPYSSIHRYIQKGVYPADWGHK